MMTQDAPVALSASERLDLRRCLLGLLDEPLTVAELVCMTHDPAAEVDHQVLLLERQGRIRDIGEGLYLRRECAEPEGADHSHQLRSVADVLANGLSERLLMALRALGPLSANKLAQIVRRPRKSQVTPALRRLETEGRVMRIGHSRYTRWAIATRWTQ